MSSLLNKTADSLHKHHGFYVSDGFIDAAVGTYGIKDGDTLEPMGTLKAFNQGIPDPRTTSTPREPRWFKDEGVSVGRWQVDFIVMGMDSASSVTVSGSGVVNASGVPVQLDVAGLQFKRQGAVEFVSLGGISPFLKLAEVYDPVFQKADWRAMN